MVQVLVCMKNSLIISILVLVLSLVSCSDPISPDFTWSPDNPKAGQTVTFTNNTVGGEDWNWYFGDERTSVLENPTHVYTKPGIYTITLRADSNDNYVKTKEIIIYDTIPSIVIDVDKVNYYENVNFSVIAYNPYAYEITYHWTFSENAVSEDIIDGKSDVSKLDVYFNNRNVNEIVRLDITIGDSSYTVVDTVFINDIPSRSLLIAQPNGNVLRQRLFDNGIEPYTTTQINAGASPFNIDVAGNELVLFDAGSNPGTMDLSANAIANIKLVDMNTMTSRTLISNVGSALNNFYSGFVSGNQLYWTDYSNYVYTANVNSSLGTLEVDKTDVPYYLVRANRLGYFGNGLANNQMTGGFKVYDGVYFWSKNNGGKGIYRFTANDILSQDVSGQGVAPETGAILTDFEIRSFAVDAINQMIYFAVTAPSEKIGLWVARINGTLPMRIDNSPMDNPINFITDIEVDNISNYVYWAYRSPEFSGASSPEGTWANYYTQNPTHKTGIKRTKLVKTFSPLFNIEYLSEGVAAYGIAIDNVKRY